MSNKYKSHDKLYSKLGMEGEKNIYKLAKTREMKPRDLNGVWCIEDEEQRVLVKVEHIKERWNSYFNGNDIKDMKDWSNMGNPMEDRNRRFV